MILGFLAPPVSMRRMRARIPERFPRAPVAVPSRKALLVTCSGRLNRSLVAELVRRRSMACGWRLTVWLAASQVASF